MCDKKQVTGVAEALRGHLILGVAVSVRRVSTDLSVRPLTEHFAPLRAAHLQAKERHLLLSWWWIRGRCLLPGSGGSRPEL